MNEIFSKFRETKVTREGDYGFICLQNNLIFYKVVEVLFSEPALLVTWSFILPKRRQMETSAINHLFKKKKNNTFYFFFFVGLLFSRMGEIF